MGRRSTIEFANELAKEFDGNPPPVTEIVKRSKTSKLGTYVCKKVGEILEKVSCKQKVIEDTQPNTPIDVNEIYYGEAGGHDKKGRVYGMGKAKDLFYSQPSCNSSAGEYFTYAPGMLVQLSQREASTREELEKTKQELRELKELVLSQHQNSTTPSTCNLGQDDELFDDMHDDDIGGGGGGGSSNVLFLA